MKTLKPNTVQSYLSSLASIHKLRDLDCDNFNDYMLKSIFKGAENLAFYESMKKGARKVMTLPLLKILSHRLAVSEKCNLDKQVLWTAMTVAFYGSFRFGELLSMSHTSYNKGETLLWEDVEFKKGCIIIHLKITKARSKGGDFVDLFQLEDPTYCPVKACEKLCKMTCKKKDKPVFMLENSKLLTSALLNSTIFKLLNPVIGESAKMITGHSFRAALPSALANRPDIASDEDVRKWGRWDSSSYKAYTRLNPNKRRFIFDKMLTALTSL